MKKADIVTGILLMIASGLVVFTASGMDYVDKDGVPGAGFVPFWTGALIFLLSAVMTAQAVRSVKATAGKPLFDREFGRNILMLVGTSAVAMALVPILGMLSAIGILTGYLSWALGYKKPKFNVAMAILTPVIFWLVFSQALEVRFPTGLLGI